MAKKDKGPGCLMYLFFILFLVCLAAWFLFSNGLNFKTLLVYGPSQYAANIWHFHDDYYCRANNSLELFEDILPAGAIDKKEGIKPIATLKSGQRFKLKGYRNREYVQWVAAKIADGPDMVYGYFMIPEKISIPTFWGTINRIQGFLDSSQEPFKNAYFSEIPRDATKNYRQSRLSELKKKLATAVDLKEETDPAKMQQIKESKDFEIIEEISSDNTIYYCPKRDYEKAINLYEAYLGNGFDSQYLQVREGYDPATEGYWKESVFLRIVDSWYFKLFAAFVLFGLLRRIFRGRKQKDNPPEPEPDPRSQKEPTNLETIPQDKIVSLTLSPEMTVGEFKEHFQNTLGPSIKVYTTVNTRRAAKDKSPLSSLRDIKGMYGNIPIDRNFTVSQAEHFFEEMGIGIQVMKLDGKGLAPNGAKLIEF